MPEPPSQERSTRSPARPGDARPRLQEPRRTSAQRSRRRAASSFVVGPRLRAGQFALPASPPSSTVFNRESFHPRSVPARLGDPSLGIHRRPPTSCAHRLRKPNRTCELLAPSVAPRTWARGLLSRAPEHPVGWPSHSTVSRAGRARRFPRGTRMMSEHPPRRARRDRRRVRTTDNERTRTPSVGSTRALRFEQLGHARCSRSWLRLAPSRSPRSHAAPSKAAGRFEPSHALLRETRERCASPTSATDQPLRAPCGSLDSRLRLG